MAEDDELDEEEEDYEEAEEDESEDDYDEDDPTEIFIDPDRISVFEKVEEQIEAFFEEFSILSRKKPDGALNKFKVGLLNHSLENANSFLDGDYRPFPEFSTFDSDSLPTASDVVMILAQYRRGLEAYRRNYTHWDTMEHRWYWNVEGHHNEFKTRAPRKN